MTIKSLLIVGLLVSGISHAQVFTVKITSSGFSPVPIEIGLGDTVEFINESRATHTVTADSSLAADPKNILLPSGAEPFHSGDIKPGETFAHVFDVAGEYGYVCIPHERHGMMGRVLVQE